MTGKSTSSMSSRLSVDENESPTQKLRFSRSPHPYQRSNAQLHSSGLDNLSLGNGRSRRSPQQANGALRKFDGSKSEYFDADGRKRRKISTSPSESGTEADDERATLILRGLPAPPLRARKGLKAASEPGGGSRASPLLTPSILDEYNNSRPGSGADSQVSSRSYTGQRTSTIAKEEMTKKRQYEVLRRLLETTSLFFVGYVSFQGALIDLPIEMKYQLSIVIGVYCVYLIRHIWHRRRQLLSGKGSPSQFRIPVSYDPAPLLYPVFLPSTVAVSLASPSANPVLPNIVLGLCSLPPETIPFPGYGCYNVHWFISIIPYVLMSRSREDFCASYSRNTPHEACTDMAALLYPLHQALLPSLNFLCTSSLLPSELQLLSAALINLLLYSRKPQSIILQALLWIGGLVIFVLCRQVLRWTVELARIPSWRFRRSRYHVRGKSVLFRAVNDSLGGFLSRIDYFKSNEDNSDSEVESRVGAIASRKRLKAVREAMNSELGSAISRGSQRVGLNDTDQPAPAHVNGNANTHHPIAVRPRRHTLPAYLAEKLQSVGLRPPLSQSSLEILKSFRSLTSAQATVLKWLCSLYVYFVVAVSIAVPVRLYVSYRALHSNEPVGWALGYLFGDIPAFRFQTVMWNMERWICLPGRSEDKTLSLCRAEKFRQLVIGAANTRLLICAYCIACIGAGLAVVFSLTAVVEVDTRRKVFHGMMVAMFLPTIFIDPAFIALAFSLILAIFLLLDLFRASQLPPISKPLTYFLAPYVDGRDHRGPIIVSHIFLLIGCAIPLWLSLAAVERTGLEAFEGWELKKRDISMVSGIICVGMGDAAASLIGRRFGRRRWPWSGGKSLEGSAAFAFAVILGLLVARLWLVFGGWEGDKGDKWIATLGKATIAATGSSFTEAVLTGGNDNVIVPMILWLLVRGLKI